MWVLAGAMAAMPPAPDTGALTAVSIRTTGDAVRLSAEDAHTLEAPIRQTFRGCAFDSVSDAEVFRGLDPAQAWRERAERPHVGARFDPPLEIRLRNGDVRPASEVLIPRPADYWLARDGDSVLLFTKCSGTANVLLDCTAPLRPHFRPDPQLCERMEESVRPRSRPRP